MGKQIKYYMGYEDFLSVARAALDNGCVIYRCSGEKNQMTLTAGASLDIISVDCRDYYFYLPEMGKLAIEECNGHQTISFDSRLYVIEAGFSKLDLNPPHITSARLYIPAGGYAKERVWIARPELLTKVYEKLVRIVKKAAPPVEIESYAANPLYCGQKLLRKVYISPAYRELVTNKDYALY